MVTSAVPPRWYLTLYGFGFAALGAGPVVLAYDLGIVCWLLMIVGMLVVSSPAWLLPLFTGRRLPDRDSPLFPATLRRSAWIAGAGFAAFAFALACSLLGVPALGLLAAAAGGVGTAFALRWTYELLDRALDTDPSIGV